MDAVEAFAFAVTKLWRDTGALLNHQGVHIGTSKPDTPAPQ